MIHHRRSLVQTLALVPVLLVAAAGCSTPPPSPGNYIETPIGTVLTYSRRLSGSFGSGDATAVWTYTEAEWQGRRALRAMNSLGGGTLHDPKTFGILVNLNAAGQPVMSYDPPVGIEWPVTVGKTWSTQHRVTLYPSNQEVAYQAAWAVEAYETVTVPAGRFDVYRVVKTGSDGEVETRWIGLQRGLPLIKRTQVRSGSHRQGPGRLEGELIEFNIPAR